MRAAKPVFFCDLTIIGTVAPATLPNSPVAGGSLEVTNAGETDDTLICASSTIAGDTQIHRMAMEGDVMRMRELSDGLIISAGGSITLQPGEFQLMFTHLNQPLVEGGAVSVTLTFERAG
jgi:copper(I)-binding protein